MIQILLLAAVIAMAAPQATADKPAPPAAAAFSGLSEKIASVRGGMEPRADAQHLFMVLEHSGIHILILKQNQLERQYLMGATIEQGTGERGVFSAMQEDSFIISFHWAGGKIQVLRKDTSHRAAPGTPEAKAAERSYPPSVIATLPVVSSGPAGGGLFAIPAEALFLEDILDIGGALKKAYPGSEDLHLSPEESTLGSLVAFPSNLEARSELLFVRSSQRGSELPDSRRIAIRIGYSITELPADGFETRPGDARVGYFQTEYRDYSRSDLKDKLDPYVRLANRWRLEKKDPAAPISEPKKPITYWIDETVPESYRPAIKAGVLAWNAAFETIGFKNAIVVKEVDKDMAPQERASFDPANAAYSMVRWFMGKDAGFAIGPSRVNPITGEIYNASVSISDSMARFLADESAIVPAKNALKGDDAYMESSAAKARAALSALEARGNLSPAERERFKQEYLTHVIAHEIGHTLGLRHNFKGSSVVSNDKLGENGLISGSVMDYLPANVTPSGKQQGPYYQTKVGPYDMWAIEYGYKPMPKDPSARSNALSEIAMRSAKNPMLAYGTDEDAYGADPDSQRFDLGADPLAFANGRAELARSLWKRLEADSSSPGTDLRRQFMTGYENYMSGVDAALPLIGGVRSGRQSTGEAYRPVSAAEQRQALAFLNKEVFSGKPVAPSPELVRRMGQDRSAEGRPSSPLPIDALNSNLQETALREVLSVQTFSRLAERAAITTDPKDAFGPRDVLASVQSGVWSEIRGEKPANIGAARRELQRRDAAIVVELMSDENMPGDARAAVRGEITSLSSHIDKALKNGKTLDRDTRLHLKDIQKAIEKVLDDKGDA